MAPLIRTVVEGSGADLVLDAGDTTINGTSVEQYCVTTFARAVPDGVELVTSPGNHDSAETSRNYARAGATVLDGSVVEVDGLRILGDRDPNETRVGAGGTAQAGKRAPPTRRSAFADVACDDEEGVDLLLIHTPAWVNGRWRAAACPPRSRATCTTGTVPNGWTMPSGTSAPAPPGRRSDNRPSGR
jgi:hypothetical protein